MKSAFALMLPTALAVCLCMSFRPASADDGITLRLSVTAEGYQALSAAPISVTSFDETETIPDTGFRHIHSPLVLVRPVDKLSPLFNQMLDNGVAFSGTVTIPGSGSGGAVVLTFNLGALSKVTTNFDGTLTQEIDIQVDKLTEAPLPAGGIDPGVTINRDFHRSTAKPPTSKSAPARPGEAGSH